jgi:hypothetical protein
MLLLWHIQHFQRVGPQTLYPMEFISPNQVCVPNFSSFGPLELILTQDATFVAHPALSVSWSTNFISYGVYIAQSSMCTRFQLIWSTRTYSDSRCYFCGQASSSSSNLVHKINVLCSLYCIVKYVYRISAHLIY